MCASRGTCGSGSGVLGVSACRCDLGTMARVEVALHYSPGCSSTDSSAFHHREDTQGEEAQRRKNRMEERTKTEVKT